MTVSKEIEKVLKNKSKGEILFISDFFQYGNYDAVRKALQRLTEKEQLIRINNGIYYYPKIDAEIGVLYPSIETIAKAIAKRDKARIIPTGNYALYLLGLSEQIPMNVVFLTDASPRKIDINNRQIVFKKTSPKNLLSSNTLTNLLIQSLKTLKQENINEHHLKIIKNHLKQSGNLKQIKQEISVAPIWIQKIITQLIKDIENEVA